VKAAPTLRAECHGAAVRYHRQWGAGAGADAWAAAISLVNAGLEGFGRAAALELKSDYVRVNVVSPPRVAETLVALKTDPAHGLAAAEVAKACLQSVKGNATGQRIDARRSFILNRHERHTSSADQK
jgi:NAD(P)-dependent dehydrogenase (short-subunit alcohol dehydrogenase family)